MLLVFSGLLEMAGGAGVCDGDSVCFCLLLFILLKTLLDDGKAPIGEDGVEINKFLLLIWLLLL